MRYDLTPIRTAIIKKSTNSNCWRGYGEKGTLLHCWWECKLIQPLWKMIWRFLKKLGIKPPYDPAIPLLGIHPEETKIERDTCMLLIIAALFTIVRTWKQPRCPLSQWFHPAISSSVVPFSSCLQSLPASGSFPVSQLFASCGQSIGVSALASVLPKKSQGWSPSEWTG